MGSLHNIVFNADVEIYDILLPKILKADIGPTSDYIPPERQEIGTVIIQLHYIFKGFREIATYNTFNFQDLSYRRITSIIVELLKADIETDVMYSTWIWIEGRELPVENKYIFHTTAQFDSLILTLKKLFDISESIFIKNKMAI